MTNIKTGAFISGLIGFAISGDRKDAMAEDPIKKQLTGLISEQKEAREQKMGFGQ